MRDFLYQTGLRLLNEEDIIRAQVRFDDSCNNGRQSFSITADIFSKTQYRGEETVKYNGRTYWNSSGGCCHDEVARAFPELAPFIKWHLTNIYAPMHYEANGLFWLELWQASLDPNHPKHSDEYLTRYGSAKLLEYFKKTIVFGWGAADEPLYLGEDLRLLSIGGARKWLARRLPYLMTLFMEDMEKVANLKLT